MEDHIITKRDLIEMLSRFPDEAKVMVEVSAIDPLDTETYTINRAEFTTFQGGIKIICHYDC